jgi:hypothetical protein
MKAFPCELSGFSRLLMKPKFDGSRRNPEVYLKKNNYKDVPISKKVKNPQE